MAKITNKNQQELNNAKKELEENIIFSQTKNGTIARNKKIKVVK